MKSKLMARGLLVGVVALGATLGQLQAWAEQAILKQGTKVQLALTKPLSTRTARKGQKVHLVTHQAIAVGSHVVVPKGTAVTGTITKVVNPSGFGKNARVYLALSNLKASNGTAIPLQTLKTPKKFKGDTGGAATGAGVLVLGPVGAVGGIFVKGKEMVFAPGRPFDAEVAADTPITY